MEISKNIKLGNGLEANYIFIYSINVEVNKNISIELHYFKDKSLYSKAIEKDSLRKEQDTLISKLTELQSKEVFDENEANNIHNKINELASKIDELREYSEYLILTRTIEIPYREDYTKEYILEEINIRI